MSLVRLADVELCLIAHNLPCAGILRLARSSRRFITALDRPFAFQCSSLSMAAESAAEVRQRVLSDRFARHIPKIVVWPNLRLDSAILLERALDALEGCRLHGLDVSRVDDLSLEWRWNAAALVPPTRLWTRLLAHPAARDLRWISAQEISTEVLQLLVTLPMLVSLSFKASSNAVPTWTLLHSASGLTDLHVQMPGFEGTCLTTFVRDRPCFSQLRSLVLDSAPLWSLAALMPQMTVAFASMSSLTCLSLVNVGHVDWLLPVVRSAPCLWDLRIDIVQRKMRHLDRASLLPSVPQVVQLLERSSGMHLSLRIVHVSPGGLSFLLHTTLYRTKYAGIKGFGSRFCLQLDRAVAMND